MSERAPSHYEPIAFDPEAVAAREAEWLRTCARRWVLRGGLYYPRDLRVVADNSGQLLPVQPLSGEGEKTHGST